MVPVVTPVSPRIPQKKAKEVRLKVVGAAAKVAKATPGSLKRTPERRRRARAGGWRGSRCVGFVGMLEGGDDPKDEEEGRDPKKPEKRKKWRKK